MLKFLEEGCEGVRGISGPQVRAAMVVRRWCWRRVMSGLVVDGLLGTVCGDRADAVRFREGEGESMAIGDGEAGGSISRCVVCVENIGWVDGG
jgi:hypothetical protein